MIEEEKFTKEFYNIITPEILYLALDNQKLKSPIHGLSHWSRVVYNGFFIADRNFSNKKLIAYFALFHDSQRESDYSDPKHGYKAALFLEKHYKKLKLDIETFDKLYEACETHSDAKNSTDKDIGTCFDADRLDLYRVGINPHDNFLSTDIAKEVYTKYLANHDDISTLNKSTLLSRSCSKLYNNRQNESVFAHWTKKILKKS